jgi:hypothetical protein
MPSLQKRRLSKLLMDNKEQLRAFAGDLERVIDRYRNEFDLTLAEAIGTLEIIKLVLFNQETNEIQK